MSPMPGRRPLLRTEPSSIERTVRDLGRRVRKIERAPTRQIFPATPVAEQAIVAAPSVPDVYLMAYESTVSDHQFVLKLSNGAWTLVADDTNLLPLTGGISGIDAPAVPVGGLGRYLGESHWVSGGGTIDLNIWRSDDDGVTWALKASGPENGDYPHGLPVCRDAAGSIWWAVRENPDGIFRIEKSADNGETSMTSYTAPNEEARCYHAAAHPTNANVIVFAGVSEPDEGTPELLTTFWVTTDGGDSWTRIQESLSAEPLTDSTCLLFSSNGDLIYATYDLEEIALDLYIHHRVYSASSPYSSFTSEDVLVVVNEGPWQGPFMASSRSPLFIGSNAGATPHGRVWRRTSSTWEELAEPFAADIRLFGLCYSTSTLYAIGMDPNNADALHVAKAENADSGSVTWEDITSEVNSAAGVTLAALAASMIWEVA